MVATAQIINVDGGFSDKIRPGAAFRAGLSLLRNINDTKQLFIIFDAIDGPQTEKNFQRFLATPDGAAMTRDRFSLAALLRDRTRLEATPPGSLGQAYLDFLCREKLDTDALAAAERDAGIATLGLEPARRAFMESGFAAHDIIHVISGYGRDPVGEACLLTHVGAQMNLKGVSLFAHALTLREQAASPHLPILKMAREAIANARAAHWLAGVDWRRQIDKSLDTVRTELFIDRPARYLEHKAEIETRRIGYPETKVA